MTSYDEIRGYVLEKYGLRVSNRWISEVKRECGMLQFFVEGEEDKKTCPDDVEKCIIEAFQYFDILNDRNDMSKYEQD